MTAQEQPAGQEYDPHRSVSAPLTEIRTVLSRAERALAQVQRTTGFDSTMPNGKQRYAEYSIHAGDDVPEMVAALTKAVELLAPWERTKR